MNDLDQAIEAWRAIDSDIRAKFVEHLRREHAELLRCRDADRLAGRLNDEATALYGAVEAVNVAAIRVLESLG